MYCFHMHLEFAIEFNFHASRIIRLSSITSISSVLRQDLAIYFVIL